MVEYFRLTYESEFTILTLSRPERRNVLSHDHLLALRTALGHIGESNARGLILAADGPVFSAGHDFSDVRDRDLAQVQELIGTCTDVMRTLQSLPQVTLAEVDGLATAAGCQLVATCDLAVASHESRFALPGGRGGWFCTTPGVALARAVGRKHALEMLLTGDAINADTALSWGLLNRVVAKAEVSTEARALLQQATRGSRRSKAVGKRAFYRQVDLDTARAYELAGEVMASASQTPEAREGIRAFLEKRAPEFAED